MYIAILGRQPALGMAELEAVYGAPATRWFSDHAAIIEADKFSIDHLGGTQKAGRIVAELRGDWRQISTKIIQKYSRSWANTDGKITLGISAYGFASTSPRDIQKTGIVLKQKLKTNSVSVRLIPNAEPALNTAASHHNKLGLSPNKVELLVVRNRDGKVIVSESIGAQNITAYTRRDQQRPKRDAFVGMLPPKLAQIMINLAARGEAEPITPSTSQGIVKSVPQPISAKRSAITASGSLAEESALEKYGEVMSERENRNYHHPRLLDPFCGTGVVLQEAALMSYRVYGTDLSEKMIDYTRTNLDWLTQLRHQNIDTTLHPGDATTTAWQPPIDIIVCETYLGQPFSAPPSPAKLTQVRGNCNHIITQFLQNAARQITPGTPLCIAIPAWRSADGNFAHLPLIQSLDQLGYTRHTFKNSKNSELLYYREDQVVARELLVLTKT